MTKSQHTQLYRKLVLELKIARIRAGLTQRDVAKKLKTYKTYVSKVESAERKIDVVELAEFCHLYGTTLSAFLKTIPLD
jgi:transcriptional regulator with XRE-family HTH domain